MPADLTFQRPSNTWVGYDWYTYTRGGVPRLRTNTTGATLACRVTDASFIECAFDHGFITLDGISTGVVAVRAYEEGMSRVTFAGGVGSEPTPDQRVFFSGGATGRFQDTIEGSTTSGTAHIVIDSVIQPAATETITASGGWTATVSAYQPTRHQSGLDFWKVVPGHRRTSIASGLNPARVYIVEVRVAAVSGLNPEIATSRGYGLDKTMRIERWRDNTGYQGAFMEFLGWVGPQGMRFLDHAGPASAANPLYYTIYGDSVVDSYITQERDDTVAPGFDTTSFNLESWPRKAIDAGVLGSVTDWDFVDGNNKTYGGWFGSDIPASLFAPTLSLSAKDGTFVSTYEDAAEVYSDIQHIRSLYPLKVGATPITGDADLHRLIDDGTLTFPLLLQKEFNNRAEVQAAFPWMHPFFSDGINSAHPTAPAWTKPQTDIVIYQLGINDAATGQPAIDPAGYTAQIEANIAAIKAEYGPNVKILMTAPHTHASNTAIRTGILAAATNLGASTINPASGVAIPGADTNLGIVDVDAAWALAPALAQAEGSHYDAAHHTRIASFVSSMMTFLIDQAIITLVSWSDSDAAPKGVWQDAGLSWQDADY